MKKVDEPDLLDEVIAFERLHALSVVDYGIFIAKVYSVFLITGNISSGSDCDLLHKIKAGFLQLVTYTTYRWHHYPQFPLLLLAALIVGSVKLSS